MNLAVFFSNFSKNESNLHWKNTIVQNCPYVFAKKRENLFWGAGAGNHQFQFPTGSFL
jgi:hypothetical protein